VKLLGRQQVRAVAAVAVGLLVLSGCGEVTPGTASVVNGTRITDEEVHDLAEAQCASVAIASMAEQGQGQASPRKKLEEGALGLLMDIELSLDFAESLDIEPRPASVQAINSQAAQFVETLPAEHRPVTEDVLHRLAEARDVMTQVGELTTGQQVTAESEQAVIDAALKRRDSWLEKVEIDTNPRYAPDQDGFPGAGDGSVSRPSSDFAKSATAAQPDAAWVRDLPANQRCG
jgi:hypothetical protein